MKSSNVSGPKVAMGRAASHPPKQSWEPHSQKLADTELFAASPTI